MSEQRRAAIVGGGLVGCLTAAMLHGEGYQVDLFEARPDPREEAQQASSRPRSINLAVSARGITALRSVDGSLAEDVLQGLVPMSGRMIHLSDGSASSQAYGLHGECINSIDRSLLNNSMLSHVDSLPGVSLHFRHKLLRANFEARELIFQEQESKETTTFHSDLVVGCDGFYSKVREQMTRVVRMDYSQSYIEHNYLELNIPPGPPKDGEAASFSLDPNHLHIWPRHDFMLIALPNQDKSFTCTLFAPPKTLQQLNNDAVIVDFLSTHFPDALPLIGRESALRCFAENPQSPLMRLTCTPYHYRDRAILLGDSSHCMPPFYGQGMNCGFEDVRMLQMCLRSSSTVEHALQKYTDERHEDLVAIQELALNNYREMSSRVVDPLYLLRKRVDALLARCLGEERWCPLYTMVTFKPDISYSEAVHREHWQQAVVGHVITGLLSSSALLVGGTAVWLLTKRWSR